MKTDNAKCFATVLLALLVLPPIALADEYEKPVKRTYIDSDHSIVLDFVAHAHLPAGRLILRPTIDEATDRAHWRCVSPDFENIEKIIPTCHHD